MDTILNLIRLAGDYVSEEVLYRIVQVVINTRSGGAGICRKNLLQGEKRNGVKKRVCVRKKRGGSGVRSDVLSAVSDCLIYILI